MRDHTTSDSTDVISVPTGRRLTALQYQELAHVPPEAEWFANLDNDRTRRAYRGDILEFMQFVGIESPTEFRMVTRAHVIAWRRDLEQRKVNQGKGRPPRKLSGASIRRKLAALSSLFEYLCDNNAVPYSPATGVKRPKVNSTEGKTPAISDDQAEQLLAAPDANTLKGKRDRAILSVLLFHALRREELCLHVMGIAKTALTPHGVYLNVVRHYVVKIGLLGARLGPHACRATATTNALENGADIAQVQEWLGHANIATTRLYDRRHMRAANSPTFKVKYSTRR